MEPRLQVALSDRPPGLIAAAGREPPAGAIAGIGRRASNPFKVSFQCRY